MGRPKKNAVAETGKKIAAAEQTELSVETATDEPSGEELLSAAAENAAAAAAEDKNAEKDGEATGKQLFDEEQVQKMIAEAVAKATKDAVEQTTAALKAQSAPQIIQIPADTEKVHFLFQAEVGDENVYEIGPQGMYGRIVGKTGSFYVPKSDLSRVMDAMFRLLLEKRWIIAVDGLTDDEREAYGVNYREGEVLDKRGFTRMVDLGKDILAIYPKLCAGHREMVAKRYHEQYIAKNQNVTREIVTELNRMSRELGSKDGDFTDIIEAMNDADLGKQ